MNTEQLKIKVLDLAIHGKLVPQNPNDEPPSVLLNKIRKEKEQLVREGKLKKDKQESIIYRGEDGKYYERIEKVVRCIDADIPYEIPDNWDWTKLKNICVFLSRGKSPKYSEKREYPVFAQKCNLKNGWISLNEARFLDPLTIDKWQDEYKLRTGDVLINSTGTGTVCRTRLFHEKCLGSYPFVVPDSHVSVVRTHKDINSYFIFYYLIANSTQQYLNNNLAGSTNQKELYIGVLEDLFISLPPLNEQNRIVAKIKELFECIDVIEQGKESIKENINATRQKILSMAIRGELVPQDPNDEPAIELLKRINPQFTPLDSVESLPQGWEWCSLNNYVKQVTDFVASGSFASLRENVKYYDTENYAILVRTLDLQNNFSKKLVFTDKHGYEFLNNSNLYGGELVLPNIGSIGKVFIVPHLNKKMTLAPNSIMLRFYDERHIAWFYYFFSSQYGKNLLYSISSSTTQAKFNKSSLKKIIVPIPPLAEQERIVRKLELLFAQLDNLEKNT